MSKPQTQGSNSLVQQVPVQLYPDPLVKLLVLEVEQLGDAPKAPRLVRVAAGKRDKVQALPAPPFLLFSANSTRGMMT